MTPLERQAAAGFIQRLREAEARRDAYQERLGLAQAQVDAIRADLGALVAVMHGEEGPHCRADFETGALYCLHSLDEFMTNEGGADAEPDE